MPERADGKVKTVSDEVKLLPCIPTPEMIAAAWAVIDGEKEATGIAKLGPGLGVREIWQAMWTRAIEATRPTDMEIRDAE